MREGLRLGVIGPLLLGVLAAVLVLAGGLPLWVLGMLALALGAAVMQRPVLGLCLFALVAPVMPWTTVTLGVRMTVSEALLALTWVGVAWQWLRGQWQTSAQVSRGATERATLWFMAWSVVPLVAGEFMVTAPGPGVVNCLRWLLNVSVLWLWPLLVRTPRQSRHVLDALVWGYGAMLALSLGMFAQTPDARTMIPVLSSLHYAHPEAIQDIFSANFARMASPWVHPNSTGGALLLGVPLALFHALSQRGWRRSLGVMVALAGVAGIVFSGSRGALICLLALVAWLARRRVPMAGRALFLGGALMGLMLLAYPPAQERLLSLFGAGDASTSVRLQEYAQFPRAVAQYPLGLGFKVDPPPPGSDLLGISNLWLNLMYKLGAPGMLLFAWVTWVWWREVRDLGDLSRMGAPQALRVGSVGAVLTALLSGLFDHYFSFTPVLVALFWLTLAIGLQQSRTHWPSQP